jgi:hypothetical protein
VGPPRGSSPSRKFGAADVARDPSAAAREASSVATASTERLLVHTTAGPEERREAEEYLAELRERLPD